MKIEINEIVRLETLPKVFYQLEQLGLMIDESLKDLDEVQTKDKAEIKKRRTEINNLNTLMEDKRKEIKKQILEPYEQFNQKYEEQIKSKLIYASGVLKEKIDELENKEKLEKEEVLREFANEYIEKYGLMDFVSFENLNINITLSASEKSLKEAIKGKLDSIHNDVQLIVLEEFKDEIMYEYKNTLDFAKAKLTVVERHRLIDKMKEITNELEEAKNEEEKIVEKVEEVIAPVEIEEESNQFTVSFKVIGTKEQIIKIREFMKELGVSYE